MTFVDTRVLLVFICILYKHGCYSSFHCFECKGRPNLEDCETVTRCTTNEICYMEQVVTTSGHVVYNSGCRDRQNCNQLRFIGKRNSTADDGSLNISRRNDIPTCEQCCDKPFCNNQGCGEVAKLPPERGPYCFHCDKQHNALECRTVTQCSSQQICIVMRFIESNDEVYSSECSPILQCMSISHLQNNRTICTNCCDRDFCNTYC